MAASNWSIEGGGVTLDKKTLKVTTYSGTVDLTADAFSSSGANVIDASGATNAVVLKGGSKATTFTTGTNGATVIGGSANDKITLGTGKDVLQYTIGSAGSDVITNYDGSNDTIHITNRTSAQTTFTDKNSSVVLTFSDSKEKLTVNKSSATGSLSLKFSNGDFVYGSLPGGATFDDNNKKTGLNVGSSVANNATIDASKIASTIKNINASGVTNANTALNIVGNGQANAITLGAGGGTVDGGYSYDAAKNASKATSDKIYGGTGADTFVFDAANGGSDVIYNYNSEQGDRIYIKDKTAAQIRELLANSKTFKDSGKNIVLTLDKSKLTIDGTPKQVIFVGSDNNTVTYGPDLPKGAYVSANKTTLYITSDTATVSSALEYAVSDTIFSANNYAPKLKTIDASTYKGSVILGSSTSSIVTELHAGSGGSTLYGSTKDDALYGGDGADIFVYNVNSLAGGGKDKYYGFSGITGNDVIKLVGYKSDTHSLTFTEKSGKSLTIAVNNKSTGKAIGQIELSENPTGKTVILVDENNYIVGTYPATKPIGLEYAEKTGIVTDGTYNGNYGDNAYLVGDLLPENNAAVNHSTASATIQAANYSTKLTVINASNVSSTIGSLLIEGNESVKNVITAPNAIELNVPDGYNALTDDPVLRTTLKGGLTQTDVLNGSSLTGSQDFFYVTPSSKSAKKDSIVYYDENDWIVVKQTQNVNQRELSSLEDGSHVTSNFVKFDDKSADAVLTLDKSVLTIKDGAGKKLNIMLVNDSGESVCAVSTGHILPTGLQYDAKKVTISVKNNAQSEAADVGGDNAELGLYYGEHTLNNAGYIKLDLNNENYFNTVKTINLNKINNANKLEDKIAKIADNSVHVTLMGNSLANDFYAGGNQSSTTIFYGGMGDMNKPEADKFYGGLGMDVFVYTKGDGNDQISDNKANSSTRLASTDVIVLGSANESSLLTEDELFITDSGSAVKVQIGTDTKKGVFTVNKVDSNTPIKFVLTKGSNTALAVASAITDGTFGTEESEFEEGTDYTVYNYGLSDETLNNAISGTNLTIGDLKDGVTVAADQKMPLTPTIKVNDISSSIKNITVSAPERIAPYIVGNNNPNVITLGAGGGTVDGGYSRDSKGKVKATADKYYGGAGADVFVYTNLYDAATQTDIGGKDIIYNYDPGNDAILINSLSDITGIKYSEKNVAITFKGYKTGSKNNVLTIQGINGNSSSLPSDTQITFLVNSDTGIVPVTYTYLDKKNTTSLSDLTPVINPWEAYTTYEGPDSSDENVLWSPDEDEPGDISVWHYTNNSWTNNGLNFTVYGIDGHYYDSTIEGGHVDVSVNAAGVRPIGISVDEPGGNIIKVDTYEDRSGSNVITRNFVEIYDFVFNSTIQAGANGVHISGLTPVYSKTDGNYDLAYMAPVGVPESEDYRGDYRLADLDGNTDNGYELLKYNGLWNLIQGESQIWQYGGAVNFTLTTDRILDVWDYNSNPDMSDWNEAYEGSPVEIHVDDSEGVNMTVGSAIKASELKFADKTEVGMYGVHLNGFSTDTTFSIGQEVPTVVGTGRNTVSATVAVPTAFVLAELDGDSVNGYEFLKKNNRWTLTTTSWDYSSGTSTSFSINLIAPTLAANDDGAPADIEVSLHPSISAAGVVSSVTSAALGTIIDFSNVELDDDAEFANSLVAFNNIATGKSGVHIIGLDQLAGDNYSSQVTVGDASYWLVNLDNDMNTSYAPYTQNDEAYTNGLELAKVNDKWTPVYNEAATNQDWAYADDNVKFTISSGAVTISSNGENEDEVIRKVFEVNDEGAVRYITVGDGGAIVVGSALTSTTVAKIGSATANSTISAILPLANINFASDTKTGADGIHLSGYAVDSKLTITEDADVEQSNEYQLVDLDGNKNNGYELMKVDSDWTLTGSVWSYDNHAENDADHIAFTFDSTSGLAATDFGQASGVSVNGSTIIFNLGTDARNKALKALTFSSLTAGISYGDGIRFQGIPEDTVVTLVAGRNSSGVPTDTTRFRIVALDDDADNGLEVMKVDNNWDLTNGAWKFANASATSLSSLEFTVNANAGIRPDTNGNGTPANITYSTAENSTVLSFANAAGFIASDLTITKIINTGKATLSGSKGMHIVLPTEASEDAGALAVDSKFAIGNDTYQIVDLDENTANGYELMKVNSNWSLAGGNWSYKNDTGAIAFEISSGAREAAANTAAGLRASDTGVPSEVTLSAANGNATLSLNESRFTNLSNISITKSNYGTVTGALHIKGADVLEGSEVTIGDAEQGYKLINLDNNKNNGYELMKIDDNWTYNVGSGVSDGKYSWNYSGTGTNGGVETSLAFRISENASISATAEGTPSGTSVNMSTVTVTLPNKLSDTTKITLLDATPGTAADAAHFIFSGVNANVLEGRNITLGTDETSTVFTLFNADGSSDNSYELTYDGWTQSTVNGFTRSGIESSRDPAPAFKYKSSKAEYYLSGTAFGKISDETEDYVGTTPLNATVVSSTGVLTIAGDVTDIDTSRDAFHVRIVNKPNLMSSNTMVVNGVTFELRNIDNNAGNGYELVNDNWTKTANNTFINLDSSGNFTLTSSQGLDTDHNNVPDGITYDSSTKTITFDATFDSTDSFEGISFVAVASWSPSLASDGFDLEVTRGGSAGGGKFNFSIEATAKPPSSDQLPAEGYSTSGYDVDDLINYENETAAVDGLNEIMDIKPLASDGADEFNLSTMLNGSDRSLTSLTYSSRHRQKK